MYNIYVCTTKVEKKENYEPIRREERYKKDRSFPTQILLILFYEIKKGKRTKIPFASQSNHFSHFSLY